MDGPAPRHSTPPNRSGGVGHYQPQGGAIHGSMQRRRHRYEYTRVLPAKGGEGGRSHMGTYIYIYIYNAYIYIYIYLFITHTYIHIHTYIIYTYKYIIYIIHTHTLSPVPELPPPNGIVPPTPPSRMSSGEGPCLFTSIHSSPRGYYSILHYVSEGTTPRQRKPSAVLTHCTNSCQSGETL